MKTITLARKPLVGTVAKNVLEYGSGSLNIGETRIGTSGGTMRSGQAEYPKLPDGREDRSGTWARTGHSILDSGTGRWPSNTILNDIAAKALDEQSGCSQSAVRRGGVGENLDPTKQGWRFKRAEGGYKDTGGASRFFKQIGEDK